MSIVGTAEVLIRPVTTGFEQELHSQTGGSFTQFRKDAEVAGADAGAGLRSGVRRETGQLAGDMERDGVKGGEALSKGAGGGLSKLAGVISSTGLPLGGLSSGMEKAGAKAEGLAGSSSKAASVLESVPTPALAAAAGVGLVAVAAVDVGEKMQSADTAIANAAGTTVGSATKIGNAFLDTAGKSEFSGVQMAQAFAQVAGQLKSTEGHALSTAEATKVMSAASDLAAAKQIDLGTATSSLAKIMQAFHIGTSGAAHAADVLYQASNATGQSVDGLANQLAKIKSKLGDTGGSLSDMAAVLVDMTNAGITGRAALGALNSAMTTVQKSATAVSIAQQTQNTILKQMSPSLQALTEKYKSGAITSSEYTKQTDKLPPAQKALASSFTTATTAIGTAETKYKQLGVTVFDAHGKFVGLGSIIEQLHPKFAKMTQQQQLAAATTIFGAGAAKQMTEVIDGGSKAFDRAAATVNKQSAAQKAAEAQAKTLHGEEKILAATFSDLAGKIGAVLIPVVTALLGAFLKLIGGISDVVKFIEAHWKPIGAVLAAPFLLLAGTFATAYAETKIVFQAIVTAITAAWGAVKSATTAVVHAIVAAWNTLVGANEAVFHVILSVVQSVWGAVRSATTAVVSVVVAVWNTATGAISSVFHAIQSVIQSVWNVVKSITQALVSAIVAVWNTVTGPIRSVFNAIQSVISTVWNTVKGLTGGLIANVIRFFATLPGKILAIFGQVLAVIAGVFGQILSAAGSLISNIVGFFASLPGKIASAIGSVVGDIAGVWGKVLSGVGDVISKIVQFFAGLPGQIASAIASIPGIISNALNPTAGVHGTVTPPNLSSLGGPNIGHRNAADIPSGPHGASDAHYNNPAMDRRQANQQISAAQAGISSGSASQLDKALALAISPASFQGLLDRLSHDHSKALEALGARLVRVHQAALTIQTDNYGAAATASATAAKTTADQTLDASKVAIAKAGETGLSGDALKAAQAQTHLDTITQTGNAAVDAAQKNADTVAAQAQKHSDQVAAHGEGSIAKAQAAADRAAAHKASADARVQRASAHAGSVSHETGPRAAHDKAVANSELADAKRQASAANAADKARAAALAKAQAAADRANTEAGKEGALNQAKAAAQLAAAQGIAQTAQATAQAAKDLADATAAAAAAADQAQAAAITKASSIVTDQAKATADSITDSTKVYLDQQAETGKKGAALTAAQAQTAMDTTTQTANAAIDAAQIGVDNAAGGTATEQAQAAAVLAQAQADALVNEATAQSVLDKDNALVNAASAPGSSTTTNAPSFHFDIHGNGTLTAGQLFSEVGWALNTGALPVAPAPAAVAA